MNPLKVHGARVLNKLGYEVIPKWRLKEFEKVQLLRAVFAHHEIDTVLDVGGNIGQYRDLIRQEVGFTGQIITFEPVKELAAAMTTRAAAEGDTQWSIQNFALGRADETRTLNVTKDSAFTSFLLPRNSPGIKNGDMGFESQIDIVKHQQTSVRRLDRVLPEMLGSLADRRLFLKVDTQGFDMEVIGGANGILDSVQALQTEVSVIPVYDRMPGMDATLAALKELGFHVSGLFPVSRDKHLRVIEFDCVMLR
jgi:FkbM family methyltransferase